MPKVVIKEGPGAGDAFELTENTVSIGREAENTIRMADRTVSRWHARIVQKKNEWWVTDLDSHNGTSVNGQKVDGQQLKHMDEVRLGNVVFMFLKDEATNMQSLMDGHQTEVTQAIDFESAPDLEDAVSGSRGDLVTSNQRLLALTQLARAATQKRSLPSLFDVVTDSLHSTLAPDHLVPIVRQSDDTLLPYVRGKNDFTGDLESTSISKDLVEKCLSQGVALLSQKPMDEEGESNEDGGGSHMSIVCAPLGTSESRGVLYCDREGKHDSYDRSDLQYLCSVAAQVGVAMENIREYERISARARTLEHEVEGQYNLVGQSPQMDKIYDFISKAAPTDASVLICGESGTGKELVARAIRYNSHRNDGPFETLNCAAMSETLVESELFGHVKGAFTGAVSDRPGRFELAHEGTLFLDEIGALPLDCQTKLLRVLETGAIRRVGDVKDRDVDARVIAATNEDLEKALEEGRFREDLYYRLDVLRTNIPPLRERQGDVELLAEHFLEVFEKKVGKPVEGFAREVHELFAMYDWPGNVRELKNVVERMVIMSEGGELGAHLLPPEIKGGDDIADAEGDIHKADDLESLDEVQKRHIQRVLRSTNGNKKKSAEILDIDRSTLYARLKRYQKQ